ncbi:hypothetical protein LOTGIDRAFT_235899 [Lottia gigantea]|uniref:Alpha-galactosidase n=1 Tax=Lottia gigantea TaxID=225164 RepID=V3Z3L2_LOTGI|nr:hypothetical protein LOTGIDRAFT_235899 [Lottia gigantea]ESO85223.1 hypothetical protein LOTGIDRAFT_235899 [Lottia gigantea]
MAFLFLLVCVLPILVQSADNGLARTPPMGWLDWERFRCNTDCVNDPDNCISENLIKTMADLMASEGYKDAGYEYVCIDDCWPSHERGPDGRLVPDPERFPSGMKALADYVHSKGLKLGIYEDFGTETCAKYPGSEFYLQTDAQTFADWGIDLLKFDTCNSYSSDFQYGFPAMAFYLNQTGRPILFSCEWPHGESESNFTAIRQACNMWRTGLDIEDSWDSVVGVIDFYAKDAQNFSSFSGPGGWADPDEVIVGDFGLSYEEERAHFGMWAMFASPLLMSVDLRNIRNSSKALLQNRNILAINQDPLGHQATLKMELANGYVYVFTRTLVDNKIAVAVLNKAFNGMPTSVTMTGKDLGLTDESGYTITDGFTGDQIGSYGPTSEIIQNVNPSGIVIFVATPK